MATLPTDESLGFAAPDPGSGRRTVIPDADAVGQAVATLGQQGERTGLSLIDKAQQQQQANTDLQMAGESSSLLRTQLDLEQKYQNDPDYQTMPGRYAADLGKAKAVALGAITDPKAKIRFGFAADDVIARSVFDMKNTAIAKQKDATAGYTTTLLDNNMNAAASSNDPHARLALLDASLAALDAAGKQGIYTQEQVAAEKVKYKANFGKAILDAMSPDQVLTALPVAPGSPVPVTPLTSGQPVTINNIDDVAARMRTKEGGTGGYEAAGGGAYQVHGGPVDENSLPAEQDAFFKTEFPKRMQQLSANLGRPVTLAEGSLAWQQGVQGATNLINNPQSNAASIVGPAAVRDNLPKGTTGRAASMTAADFVSQVKGYYGLPDAAEQGGGTQATGPATAPAPQAQPTMDDVFASMLPGERLAYRTQALAALNKDQNQALTALHDSNAKDGWDLASQGKLTYQWVEDNKANLDKTDFTALVKEATGTGATKDDPNTLIDLQTKLGKQDISDFAANDVKNGLITTGTYNAFMDKNRSLFGGANEIPTPYKAGREYLSKSLDPGALTGSAQQFLRVAQAGALQEFDDWALQNPNAPRADYDSQAQAIAKRYQVMNYQQTSFALGLPQFYSGNRDALTTKDIDAAEAKALAEKDAGRWSDVQLMNELRKLQNWRAVLNQGGGPTLPPPPKTGTAPAAGPVNPAIPE